MTPDDAVARLAAAERLLVALDFDGTLSPLVDEPMAARMLPAARDALDALLAAPATTVALVSGRSLADLRVIAEHDDASRILLAGSHGAEHWAPGDAERESGDDDGPSPEEVVERDRLIEEAERLIADVPGAWIEAKAFGFAVPSRRVDEERRIELHERVDALVRTQAPSWRRRTGHAIVEYAFREEGKDAAVAWLRAHTDASAVLFAGDDVTDEDALRTLGEGDVGVRVGPGESAADLRVEDIPKLADLLVRLAHERTLARE